MSIGDLIEAAKFLEKLETSSKESAVYYGSQLNLLCHCSAADNNASRCATVASTTTEADNIAVGATAPPPAKKRRISNEESLFDSVNKHQNDKCQAAIRRANMRSYFEKLKELVPLCPDTNRHTTVTLLTKAAPYIKTLEEEERQLQREKSFLLAHEKFLKNRMQTLTGQTKSGFDKTTSAKRKSTESHQETIVDRTLVKIENDTKFEKDRSESRKHSRDTKLFDKATTCDHKRSHAISDNEVKALKSIDATTDINCNKIICSSASENFVDLYQLQLNALFSYYNYFKELSNRSVERRGLGLTPHVLLSDEYLKDNKRSNFPYHLLSAPIQQQMCTYGTLVNGDDDVVKDDGYNASFVNMRKGSNLDKIFNSTPSANATIPNISSLMSPLNN